MASADKPGRDSTDGIEMLKADHKSVKTLFKKFAALKEDGDADNDHEKQAIVRQICTALTVHTTIEEEIFYPAVRAAITDADLMDEALVEHAGAKDLIAQLREMHPDDELYGAKVTVLGEQIDHHVEEEEGDMFPKARKAKVDTEELGKEMAARREDLKAELESDEDDVSMPKTKRSTKRSEARR